MSFVISAECAAAQLAATIAFADGSIGPSVLRFYDTPQPAPGGEPGASHLVEIALEKPCATLASGGMTLHPLVPSGSMVLASGVPLWARWQRSDGAWIGDGPVSDAAGMGVFKISGGFTPPGGSSPQLYAGGLVQLGVVIFD